MDSFRLVGADGHSYAGHLRDELLDEALAVLVGADEVPEGLSAVDKDAGPVEVALRLFEVGVEHGVFFLQQPDHLIPLGEGVDPLCCHPAGLVEGGVCRMLGAGLHRGRSRFFCRRGRTIAVRYFYIQKSGELIAILSFTKSSRVMLSTYLLITS